MNLGKCPICKKYGLEIFKSLDIDGFKRYDLKCETIGCLINFREFQYDDRDQLISIARSSQKLAGIKDINVVYQVDKKLAGISKAKKRKKVIHYEKNGKGICGHNGKLTANIKSVTCGNCKNNNEFKKLSPVIINPKSKKQ